MANQPVDSAMAAERPAKSIVRAWWLDAIKKKKDYAEQHGEVLYLTLPGKNGLDIKLLIDNGVIAVTEAGPIEVRVPPQIVAFEKNTEAYAAVKRRFPGLTVRSNDLLESVGGPAPDVFSRPDQKKFARAAVVNLDFTIPWQLPDAGRAMLLTVISKFAAIHEGRTSGKNVVPPMNWTLCLTVNAALLGPHDLRKSELAFIEDQTKNVDSLHESIFLEIKPHLGSLYADSSPLAEPYSPLCQKILGVLIPLRIIHMLVNDGWAVYCKKAAGYGGNDGAAAMVTFIFEIVADPRAVSQPTDMLLACRKSIPEALTFIGDDGIESLFFH